jgi:hypothetical protein
MAVRLLFTWKISADDSTSFVLEGIPAVIIGIAIWFYLPDYPETAKFLTEEEREFAVARMGPYAPKGESMRVWRRAGLIGILFRYRQAL